VDAWAVRRGRELTVLLTNHAMPGQPISRQAVRIEIQGARTSSGSVIRRIDEEHANPVAAWWAMGAPEYPSPRQVDELIEASEIRAEGVVSERADGRLGLTVELPAHAVAAITIPAP
jgi:xylan 1,4-beta-xylosidase